ncbi:MAG: phosphatidylglycerophosphatase A [Candidatus Thermoplasmatota archaeon]
MQINILELLAEKGITIGAMVQAAVALYTPWAKVDKNKSLREIKRKLKSMIIKQCEDINVQLLISAAAYLEDKHQTGEIKIAGDPVNVLCDELIGIAIAEYIGGKKALFNYIRYDTKKPGILAKLGIFLDDAVAGLIAGCMTKLFEDW